MASQVEVLVASMQSAVGQEEERREQLQYVAQLALEAAEDQKTFPVETVRLSDVCYDDSRESDCSSVSTWESGDESLDEASSSDESPPECQDRDGGETQETTPEPTPRRKRKFGASETSEEIKAAVANFVEQNGEPYDDERYVPEIKKWINMPGVTGHFVMLPTSLQPISPILGKDASTPMLEEDDPASTIPRQGCVAVSSVAYFDIRGDPCNFTQVRSAVFDYDPSLHSRQAASLEEDAENRASRVPSLFELALRSGYSPRGATELEDCLEPHHGFGVRRAVKTMRQSVWQVGCTRCAACGQRFVLPRTEWIEWLRGTGHIDPLLPILRRGCSWKCLPDVESVDKGWTGWRTEVHRDNDDNDSELSPKAKRPRLD